LRLFEPCVHVFINYGKQQCLNIFPDILKPDSHAIGAIGNTSL
jgi:hypothetical protein